MRRRQGHAVVPALACPRCGRLELDGVEQRFCPTCGLPLVLDQDNPGLATARDWRHDRARKIKPQLAEGKLVHVVQARNQTEAEFIQGLLLEEGVPSLIRRSAGFDVPDFLAAGPRDLLVPQSGLDAAREILLQADILSAAPLPARPVAPLRLLAGLIGALAVGLAIIWLLALAIH